MEILTFILLMFLGWPVAILLAVLLHKSRKRLRTAERPEGRERARYFEKGEAARFSLSEALDLATVRLDLDRRHAAGLLPTERNSELFAGIEGLWMEQLRAVEAGPGSEEWCARRARAFDLVAARRLVAGETPWVEAGRARPQTEPSVAASDGQPLLSAGIGGEPPIASPGLPIVVPGTAVGTAPLMDGPDARGPLASDGLMEGIEGRAPRDDRIAPLLTPSRPEGELRSQMVSQRPFESADPTRSPALPLPASGRGLGG